MILFPRVTTARSSIGSRMGYLQILRTLTDNKIEFSVHYVGSENSPVITGKSSLNNAQVGVLAHLGAGIDQNGSWMILPPKPGDIIGENN